MSPTASVSPRRIERLLFAGFLGTFAYFQPGGGWNQNARFAQVRAIVEEGRLAIDSFLVYDLVAGADGAPSLRRAPVVRGEVVVGGERRRLGWPDGTGRIVPVDPTSDPSLPLVPLVQIAATGDVSYARGSFYPNKAPGTSFLAVPAYALVFRLERFAGVDPDGVVALTINAWLASAGSVGLLAALGCVLFFRTALRLSEGRLRASASATLAFGAGTMIFPYATMLFEHDVMAVFLLLSFYLLLLFLSSDPRRLLPWLAGASAGFAVVTSYTAAPAILILLAYLLWKRREAKLAIAFLGGAALPGLVLAAYHLACFGSPFTTAYAGETPAFRSAGGLLFSLFSAPSAGVATALLVSPFRGLFVSSPVLILGVIGLAKLLRGKPLRAEAMVCASMLGYFLLVNASFNGWHGGAAGVPRYLAGAVPFLALPLVFAFEGMRRTAALLASVSAAAMLLLTAVDPQCPLGVLPIATVPGRPLFWYDPWTEYEIPLFVSGTAGPARRDIAARGGDEATLATIEGPVSVNPVGMYEGWLYTKFPPGGPEARGSSLNAGEAFAPGSRASLLPLLGGWGAALVVLRRRASER